MTRRRISQTVPLEFDDQDPTAILEIVEADGLVTVRWKKTGLTIVHSKLGASAFSPEPEDIAKNTPAFRGLNGHGFTLGKYAEIIVYDQGYESLVSAVLKIGSVEATLGHVTPLGRYIMGRYHDNDVHGEWDSIWSLRLWNCPEHLVEEYALFAHRILKKQYGLDLDFSSLEFEYPDEPHQPQTIRADLPPAALDIEPARLYYRGYSEHDDASAVLQFYRVLEYYSIATKHLELDQLRRRTDLNSREFVVQIAKALGGEERADICRLVARVVNTSMLTSFVQNKLMDRMDPNLLGNKIYDLRNSIVHAKYDHRSAMFVPSIFSTTPEIAAWRAAFDVLASAALDAFSARDTA